MQKVEIVKEQILHGFTYNDYVFFLNKEIKEHT